MGVKRGVTLKKKWRENIREGEGNWENRATLTAEESRYGEMKKKKKPKLSLPQL